MSYLSFLLKSVFDDFLDLLLSGPLGRSSAELSATWSLEDLVCIFLAAVSFLSSKLLWDNYRELLAVNSLESFWLRVFLFVKSVLAPILAVLEILSCVFKLAVVGFSRAFSAL